MRHARKTFVLALLCLAAAACVGSTPAALVDVAPQPLALHARPQLFKLDDPTARQVGRLIWRGGLSLTANSPNFGGWSDLRVTPDGRHLTSIADVGGWFTATMDYDKDGNLAGVSDGRIGPLRDLDGRPLASKEWADSEGMALLPDGTWLVSFERHHRIWHYPTLDGVPTEVVGPSDIGKQPDNGGIETITALANGRVIAISEQYVVRPGMAAGWIGEPTGNGRYHWDAFEYAKIPDFDPTAIAELPDGSFVLLERAFDFLHGIRIRVMHVAADAIRPGATVHAEELARLETPYAVDNLEGISAATGPRGETLLWMIADDNFNPLQRTLLLMFELAK
jgi:hypothetical protein